MKKPIEVTSENFKKTVLEAEMPVLVDFWAPWCGPCVMMAPVLDAIANDMGDQIVVAKLNVDDPAAHAIASEYHISSIPNMQLFKGGRVVANFIGYRPEEVIKGELQKALLGNG